MKIDLNVLWKTPNAKPLYQQLKELVQGAILAGIYLPGEKLESEREFIEKGNLSYPTVSRALRELAQEGYIIRKVGSGSFVCPHFPMVPSQIKNIVAIYYNLDTPYFKRLRSGIEAECRARDIRLHCIAGLTLSEEKRILTRNSKRKIRCNSRLSLRLDGTQSTLVGNDRQGDSCRYDRLLPVSM